MRCQEFESRWTRGELTLDGDSKLRNHLASCPSCRRLATRTESLRQDLRALQANVEPDGGFSARVLQRIAAPPDDVEILGWAAWRLVPGAMVLLAGLLAWGTAFGWTPASLEVLLLQDDPSQVAVRLLVAGEDDR